MGKYKNKDGIELNYTGNDIHTKLVKEVIEEAIKISDNYNFYDKTSMRFALRNIKNFLKTNFDLGDKNGR